MRPHDLLHSYATILLAAGEHPKVVQEILGHSSVQLTLDTYSHLLPDLMLKKRAAAKLDAILSGGNDNPAETPARPLGSAYKGIPSEMVPTSSPAPLNTSSFTLKGALGV